MAISAQRHKVLDRETNLAVIDYDKIDSNDSYNTPIAKATALLDNLKDKAKRSIASIKDIIKAVQKASAKVIAKVKKIMDKIVAAWDKLKLPAFLKNLLDKIKSFNLDGFKNFFINLLNIGRTMLCNSLGMLMNFLEGFTLPDSILGGLLGKLMFTWSNQMCSKYDKDYLKSLNPLKKLEKLVGATYNEVMTSELVLAYMAFNKKKEEKYKNNSPQVVTSNTYISTVVEQGPVVANSMLQRAEISNTQKEQIINDSYLAISKPKPTTNDIRSKLETILSLPKEQQLDALETYIDELGTNYKTTIEEKDKLLSLVNGKLTAKEKQDIVDSVLASLLSIFGVSQTVSDLVARLSDPNLTPEERASIIAQIRSHFLSTPISEEDKLVIITPINDKLLELSVALEDTNRIVSKLEKDLTNSKLTIEDQVRIIAELQATIDAGVITEEKLNNTISALENELTNLSIPEEKKEAVISTLEQDLSNKYINNTQRTTVVNNMTSVLLESGMSSAYQRQLIDMFKLMISSLKLDPSRTEEILNGIESAFVTTNINAAKKQQVLVRLNQLLDEEELITEERRNTIVVNLNSYMRSLGISELDRISLNKEIDTLLTNTKLTRQNKSDMYDKAMSELDGLDIESDTKSLVMDGFIDEVEGLGISVEQKQDSIDRLTKELRELGLTEEQITNLIATLDLDSVGVSAEAREAILATARLQLSILDVDSSDEMSLVEEASRTEMTEDERLAKLNETSNELGEKEGIPNKEDLLLGSIGDLKKIAMIDPERRTKGIEDQHYADRLGAFIHQLKGIDLDTINVNTLSPEEKIFLGKLKEFRLRIMNDPSLLNRGIESGSWSDVDFNSLFPDLSPEELAMLIEYFKTNSFDLGTHRPLDLHPTTLVLMGAICA